MKLKDLLKGISPLSATADPETEIARISYDSRTTAAGDLFVAMTGFAADGHAYIPRAMAAGAAAVVCERLPEGDVPYVQVDDARRALAVMGANYYGHPADDMTMVAVTGTNGKTTTTYLLKAILEQAEHLVRETQQLGSDQKRQLRPCQHAVGYGRRILG